MERRIFSPLGAGIAAVVLLLAAGCSGNSGGAVVTVNGQAITKAQLDQKLENGPAAKQELQTLVTNALIDQYAKSHNITVSQADIDKIENTYKVNYPGNQWNELLQARGMTEQDVQGLIRRQIVLDKAVGANINISEKQIAAYFKTNRKTFNKPAQARARHILVSNLATANQIYAELKVGKDFATLAEQNSIDPGSKSKGGELGWFPEGQMMPSFDKVAFSAPIGKIMPPVKSPFGYHIIQVEERKPAQIATLASVHDQIAQQLRQQQEAPLIPAFLQQLQQSAKIDINDPRYTGLFPSPPPGAAAPAPTTAAAPAPTASAK